MKRIIWHWTAGGHTANAVDRAAYHFIIEGDGNVVRGTHRVEDNLNIYDDHYARHTRNLNTGSIGVAVAAMHDAQERPFRTGPYPITNEQVEELCRFTAELCNKYNISVSPTTVLSHAEVEPVLKVKQRNKWDIIWLPGMPSPGDPIAVGNRLRQKTLWYYNRQKPNKPSPKHVVKPGRSLLDAIRAMLKALGVIK